MGIHPANFNPKQKKYTNRTSPRQNESKMSTLCFQQHDSSLKTNYIMAVAPIMNHDHILLKISPTKINIYL